jgi:cysteine/O-acetylserine efflux protein
MSTTLFLSFIGYAVATAITPGPNNFLTLNTSSTYGFKKSIPLLMGIMSGIVSVLTITVIMSYSLAQILPQLTLISKYLGSIYILWLAYHIYQSKPNQLDGSSKHPGFKQGYALQFVNVKILLYGITSISSFVLPYYTDLFTIALFALILVLISSVCLVIWAGAGVLLQNFYRKHFKIINTLMAIVLLESIYSLFMK